MSANPHVRMLLGLLLGASAGLSLTVSVLPAVLRLAGVGNELPLARALLPLWPWAALLGAAGGWSAVRVGTVPGAALVFGAVGAVTGVLLVAFTPFLSTRSVAAALVAGGMYEALAGLILGRLFPGREPGDEASS